ncbi:MAG: ectoine hydroxylase-related dioxygenase (phytanoyl-CoA dioxygenase family) [Gammaproteobacteria bacterium]|jgi:ectoine hydroxylase-related dioxygenase (phytanoyl-CoA dioxygenase family)
MLSKSQLWFFAENGFVIVEHFVPVDLVNAAKTRIEPLFRGEFETSIQPDEWNWREGISPANHTRQICNGWKSDLNIARIVLRQAVGQYAAQLMNWPGARINQDNVIWKPPGAQALGFHQDNAYQDWIVPASMLSCWMTMDDTRADGGTIEYVPGSHRWPVAEKIRQFHAPDDYHEALKQAAAQRNIGDYKIVKIEINAGDAVFHHGAIWHGSGPNNSDQPRRSLVSHCMSSEARFHDTITTPIYSRYKLAGSTTMDESFFPILWLDGEERSDFLANYLSGRNTFSQ